jgi:hypothetical protein
VRAGMAIAPCWRIAGVAAAAALMSNNYLILIRVLSPGRNLICGGYTGVGFELPSLVVV